MHIFWMSDFIKEFDRLFQSNLRCILCVLKWNSYGEKKPWAKLGQKTYLFIHLKNTVQKDSSI